MNMNAMRKAGSWENLNGMSEGTIVCDLNNMNCVDEREAIVCSINDMNCVEGNQKLECSLTDMNCVGQY